MDWDGDKSYLNFVQLALQKFICTLFLGDPPLHLGVVARLVSLQLQLQSNDLSLEGERVRLQVVSITVLAAAVPQNPCLLTTSKLYLLNAYVPTYLLTYLVGCGIATANLTDNMREKVGESQGKGDKWRLHRLIGFECGDISYCSISELDAVASTNLLSSVSGPNIIYNLSLFSPDLGSNVGTTAELSLCRREEEEQEKGKCAGDGGESH